MDILPAQAPGPTRRTPNINPQHGLIAVVVIVALIAGYLVFGRGGGSSPTPAVAAVPAAAQPTSKPATLPKMSATAFVRRVKGAIRRQAGVHIEYNEVIRKSEYAVTVDLGKHAGRESLNAGGDFLDVRFVHGVLYVQGSPVLLLAVLHFPVDVAVAAGGHWVAVHRGDAPYANGIKGMTIKGLKSKRFGLHGHLKLVGPQEQQGVTAIGIRGHERSRHKVTDTVWVQAAGDPLPVVEIEDRKGKHYSTYFDSWNAGVHVKAPGGAVSYQNAVASASGALGGLA